MTPGATPTPTGVRFCVWAPDADLVEVVLDGPHRAVPLDAAERGHWVAEVDDVGAGARYRYRIDGGPALPDPASRHQPDGVHGPSAVVDPSTFTWADEHWTGPPSGQGSSPTVVYELHVGTFTPEGTFAAAAEHLGRLADLGITMVELMPVNAFPGRRNWGYDGVFPWAAQATYGGPEGLAAFVDAAHAHGVGVILDVVHNHLGPEGNVLATYGPYFTDAYSTPWGPALNFSRAGSDEVRRYFIASAVAWVRDHHVDGLRLDAVHAIVDPTARPFLEELVTEVHEAAAAAGRRCLVMAESSDNDPRLVRSPADGGIGCDAVWNDDFHHALRVSLTGDISGYYADYAAGPADLAEAYAHGFVLRGRYSTSRGRRHGRPATGVAPSRFVVCSQNHDQVGNRQHGERLDHHLDPARRRLAAAAVLLSPFIPLVFMGEEYGEPNPFPYFVDHGDPELLDAVRRGRAAEFSAFGWSGDIPDPAAESTFLSAVLDPSRRDQPEHAALETLYHDLLALRRSRPELTSGWPSVTHDDGLIVLTHPGADGGRLLVALAFCDEPRTLDDVSPSADRLLTTAPHDHPVTTVEGWSATVVADPLHVVRGV